ATDYNTFVNQVTAFLDEQMVGKSFVLDGVAGLIPVDSVRADRAKDYRPYMPPEDQLPYPRDNFVDLLLKLTRPGETSVQRDRGDNYYYLSVLLHRYPCADASDERFARERQQAIKDFKASYDDLWERFLARRQRALEEDFVKQLRRQATKD